MSTNFETNVSHKFKLSNRRKKYKKKSQEADLDSRPRKYGKETMMMGELMRQMSWEEARRKQIEQLS